MSHAEAGGRIIFAASHDKLRLNSSMSEAPRGTVSFLFTDIVGSTRLWEKFPQRMAESLARHDALMRAAIAAHGGHVFKTVGDAFCVAFHTPRAALEAAIDSQRRLAAENWGELGSLTVRMGLHTGAAEFRDNDYFGGTLNRAARIEAAAHGGQILLSQISHDLLADETLADVTFTSLGNHHLRNLDRPERLFQVVARGLPDTFPPPRTMEVLPNNLPAQSTSFVGREREIEEIKRLLKTTRLLTLVGTGGTGKTRLSLEAGAQLIHDFPDGVWFAELAVIVEPDRVVEVVAAAVGARGEAARPLRETLVAFLRSKNLLLILDNCEHLLQAAASLAADILRACPNVKILATSRHNLGAVGEFAFPVPPLGMLDVRIVKLSGPNVVERLSQYEAVRLFIERATAVRPDFTVTNANAPALAEICSRLDGIPLAIELAAARIRVLDLEQIAARLDDRFRLLRRGAAAGGMPHQDTLQALIDWSHDLLSGQERTLFRRAAAFIGGRTLEAVEAVCSGDGLQKPEILDLVEQLVDKSLLNVEHEAGELPRYTMIESIWEYAHEKLAQSGESDALRDRHLEYFLRFAETAAPQMEGPRQKEWLDRCQREIFNFRFAFEWALESRKAESGSRLVVALCRFAEIRGTLEEVRNVITQLLQIDDSAVSLQRKADFRLAAGRIAWVGDRYAEARTFFTEAQSRYDGLNDRVGFALAGSFLGVIDAHEGRMESAERYFKEALDTGRNLAHAYLEAFGLTGLGSIAMDREDLQAARDMTEQALAIYERKKDYWTIGLILWSITRVAIAQKDYSRARSALADWTAITRELGNEWAVPYILDFYAVLALDNGESVQAARLFGAADALREHVAAQLSPLEQSQRDKSLDRLRAIVPENLLPQELAKGRAASPWDLLPAA